MKAHDKWWEENNDDSLCYEAARSAWKAALRWAKSRSVHRLISINEIDEELNERKKDD